MQGLFTDIEDKTRRLRILKALLSSLNYGDAINAEIDAEIKAIEEAAKTEDNETDNESAGSEELGNDDLGSLDALESINSNGGELTLLEEQEFSDLDANMILTEDELPIPADLDAEKDFSENE